jgi:hypothetical protein
MGCFARQKRDHGNCRNGRGVDDGGVFCRLPVRFAGVLCSENPRSLIVRAIYTIAEKASDLIAKDA